MKNFVAPLLLAGTISSVVARPTPLSDQPQHGDKTVGTADLNTTQNSEPETPRSAVLDRREGPSMEGMCEKFVYQWPSATGVLTSWKCDELPNLEACLPQHKSKRPKVAVMEMWWVEMRHQQLKKCKDQACRNEVNDLYDRIRDEAAAKPDPDWGTVGTGPGSRDKEKTELKNDEIPDVYWPCGRYPPFNMPGHPARPFTFESCLNGSCGPPIEKDWTAHRDPLD